ncbi:MAG TPA: hypothetical protein VF718_06640 [Allosphingosinicella sp.]|jgi:hypothetical protein
MVRKSSAARWGLSLAAAVLAAQPLAAQKSDAAKPAPAEKADKDNDKTVFHRAGTDFDTALADVQECDGYARGISYHLGGGPVPYPYAGTVAGAVGGAIGSVLADAIFGAAERRKLRRRNMRTCMGFKEYTRFEVSEAAWKAYAFSDDDAEGEEKRLLLLRTHARIASAPAAPQGEIVE